MDIGITNILLFYLILAILSVPMAVFVYIAYQESRAKLKLKSR